MSFIMKPNNRKSRSGSVLRAKIVSEDQTEFVTKDYPVIVLTENPSDQDRVLRDKQIVESILDSANSDENNKWEYMTESIRELASTTQKYGSNEAYIGEAKISNGGEYMNSSGVVVKRPIYDPDAISSEHVARLTIDITYNKAKATIEREIHIPAYTAEEVIGLLESFTNDSFWNAIKGTNKKPSYVFGNFTNPTTDVISTINTYNSANPKIRMQDIIKVDNPNSIPNFEISYPIYDSPVGAMVANNTTYNSMTATAIYQLKDNSLYSVKEIKDTDSLDQEKQIILHDPSANTIATHGCTIAYGFWGKSNNTARGVFSYPAEQNPKGTTRVVTSSLQFMSQLIPASSIKNNLSSSALTSWVLPPSYFDEFNADTSTLYVLGEDFHPAEFKRNPSSASVILFKPNTNIVIKLPAKFSQLPSLQTYEKLDYIKDTEKIGYKTNDDGSLSGFSDSMANFVIECMTEGDDKGFYITEEAPSITDTTVTSSGTKTKTAGTANTSSTQYLYIPSDEFDAMGGQLSFSFQIVFKQNILFEASQEASLLTFYFDIRRSNA